MTRRNVLLDYVRGTACILIVLYHYTERYNELFQNSNGWGVRIRWGYMAVATFFMLSGYFAAVKDESDTGVFTYIKKRGIRLFPAYWVAIPITFLITYYCLPSRSVRLLDALFNFTMLESFFGVALVDGIYWTLANELIFYFFILIIVIILKKRDKLPYFGMAWVLALFAYFFIENDSLLSLAIGKVIAKHYGHMFVTGVCVAFLAHPIGKMQTKIVSGITIVASIIYQYITFGLGYCGFFIASFATILFCVIAFERGIKINRVLRTILLPLEFIASISYPLYLLHQNIGYAILETFRPLLTEKEIIILLPMIITGSAAYLIHRLVEIPATKKLSEKSKKAEC